MTVRNESNIWWHGKDTKILSETIYMKGISSESIYKKGIL